MRASERVCHTVCCLCAGVERQFVTSGCSLSGLTEPIHIDSVWNHAQYAPAPPAHRRPHRAEECVATHLGKQRVRRVLRRVRRLLWPLAGGRADGRKGGY